ncbi:MAG: SCP2 sterol-binding domain-containing protein [Archaeoglobaceae archaeon]|nr:SCP2 sterol-binding domain-containing protein [Archaeoglobaceae archaeon]MDW8128256.1 SCP2 sterol-binding domain-containing protein [Archaeoglobaceae archaeon]
MAVVYPSKDWLDELKKKVNSDETYRKVAANWEGDYLCIIEIDQEALKDFQKPKILAGLISMIAVIPKEKREGLKGTPTEKMLQKLGLSVDQDLDLSKLNFEELAKKMAEIKLEEIKGASTYVWFDFWHGEMRQAMPVVPGEIKNPRFILSGPYSAFKEIVMGKVDPTTQIMRGKLKLKGDLGYMMRNTATVNRFSQLMASIPIDLG